MPVPPEYQRASDHFMDFLVTARERADLQTTHQAFTMVQGVLQTFRRRLSVGEALRFAQVLPPGLRALFVADWDGTEARQPFADRVTLTAEVRRLRADHNFAPDHAIPATAAALRQHVDPSALDAVLHGLGREATDFWRP